MSMVHFDLAMELAKKIKYYKVRSGIDDKLIQKIEKTFGFKLSPQHYKYYKEYAYLSFEGNEFFGVYPKCFEGDYCANAVVATISDRKDYGLPEKWIPIYNYDEDMAYLDYENLNKEGEPRIIAAYYDGEKYVFEEELAEDLGDYFLSMVKIYYEA